MHRRRFLSDLAAAGVVAQSLSEMADGVNPNSASPIRIEVDPARARQQIPANFIGLGYEISSVATSGLLTAQNQTYVQLVRTLGAHGVIRIGGNTSDYSRFSKTGTALPSPKNTVVNEQCLRDLGTFLHATSWDLIWGLNLGRGTEAEAVEEALAVLSAAKDKLLALEIGNEPDLFGKVHRQKPYRYEDFLKEYRRFKAAIRSRAPNAPFAGPDAASSTDWVTRFATDEGHDLKLLTHHYYRECANPGSTCEKLLHSDPKLTPELRKLHSASESSGLPYRICETNSFCGGGKPGVSDTFCAALWTLDFMFTLVNAGAAGVNIETGVNQLGFISSYSPIGDDERGTYTATPGYYGMLAFAQACHGRPVPIDYDPGAANLTAHAMLDQENRLQIALINKDPSKRCIDRSQRAASKKWNRAATSWAILRKQERSNVRRSRNIP